jgi:hypothetical protein
MTRTELNCEFQFSVPKNGTEASLASMQRNEMRIHVTCSDDLKRVPVMLIVNGGNSNIIYVGFNEGIGFKGEAA